MAEDQGPPPGWPEWSRWSKSCPTPPPPGGKAWLEAAKRGDRMAMEPLLREDARVLTYNGRGCSLGMIGHTALHWAASKGYAGLAQWLISEGLSVNVVNNANSTPLHSAAQNGQQLVADKLLAAGCDTKLTNSDGQRAYDVAVERNQSRLAKSIAEAGAQAALPSMLDELQARDESTWKVSEMKQALKLSKVDIDGVAEKSELKKLLRDVLDSSSSSSSTAASASAAAAASAPTPPAQPPSVEPAAQAPPDVPLVTDVPEPAAPEPVAPEPPPPQPSAAMAAKLAALDVSSDDDDDAAQQAGAERAKTAGNKAFAEGDFAAAVKHFGTAIRLTPKNHVLYSNRSGAHASLGHANDALSDANECLKLAAQWAKGYGRKGAALVLGGQYKEAMRAYKAGLEIEPQVDGFRRLLTASDDF